MTRVLSYNILAGGYSLQGNGGRRVNQLTSIIRSAQPDIVGIAEATNPRRSQRPLVIEEIAERLDMQVVMNDHSVTRHLSDYQVAVLTRLPIVHTQIHRHSNVLTKPVPEVCVEEANGQQLTVFITHLSAAFNRGWAGEHIRRREVQELLRMMAPKQGSPHLLMGDFNALAPGDPFKASFLLDYVVNLDGRHTKELEAMEGHPYLNSIVPPRLRLFNPLLRIIPKSRLLSTLFDRAASFYAPRGSIALIRSAGYIDCYRRMNPHECGFTCPASAPAGRIDYIFASPELADRLAASSVITAGEGLRGNEASDHLAVLAEFGEKVKPEGEEKLTMPTVEPDEEVKI